MSLRYAICPSPWRSLTKQRGAFAFLLLPNTVICYLLNADTHTHKEADAEEERKKRNIMSCKMHTVRQFFHLFVPLTLKVSVMWDFMRVHARLKYTLKSWSLSSGERQKELLNAIEICLWHKFNLSLLRSKNPADFSFNSTFSLSLSVAFISYISPVTSSRCQSQYSTKK